MRKQTFFILLLVPILAGCYTAIKSSGKYYSEFGDGNDTYDVSDSSNSDVDEFEPIFQNDDFSRTTYNSYYYTPPYRSPFYASWYYRPDANYVWSLGYGYNPYSGDPWNVYYDPYYYWGGCYYPTGGGHTTAYTPRSTAARNYGRRSGLHGGGTITYGNRRSSSGTISTSNTSGTKNNRRGYKTTSGARNEGAKREGSAKGQSRENKKDDSGDTKRSKREYKK